MATPTEDASRPPTPTINHQTFIISPDSDLTVTVLSVKNDRGERSKALFKVHKEALTENSEYFQHSLRFNAANNHNNVELKDDDIRAMRVWFIYMHEKPTSREEAAAIFMRGEVRNTNIDDIWHIVNAGDKYLFAPKILRRFFGLWYTKNITSKVTNRTLDKDLARQVALPCYMFDHAQGFAEITRWLAYNFVGHITEKRPPGFKFDHMHLAPPNFVGPMNHARGHLRATIHRGIWHKIGELLEEQDCSCGEWASTAGRYFAALVDTDAYPLEKAFTHSSINEIIHRLGNFSMNKSLSSRSCDTCNENWKGQVMRAQSMTETNFDGLCIDCMEVSRPTRSNDDKEYWKELGFHHERWDDNCRISHGQSTWYVSWCGRPEHRKQLLDLQRAKGRG